MRKFNLNWGVMVAAVVLFLYTYVSFLGLLYLVDGVIWKAALAGLAVIGIVSVCVYVMCLAKATKWKGVGIVGQSVFGAIILVAFLASGIPFTSFLKVMENRSNIEKSINDVRTSAEGLNTAYNEYVLTRVDEYGQWLGDNSQVYQKAGGKDSIDKIANLTTSLERHLHPDSLDVRQKERKEWIGAIGEMSIYNIMLPRNLQYMQRCVDEWSKEYENMSKITYDGAPYEEFKYDKFSKSLTEVVTTLKKVSLSMWAIVVAILAFFVMLLPYWLTKKTLNDPKANNGEIVFK